MAKAIPQPSSQVKDYIELLKPGVMGLVVFTGITGLVIAPGHLHPFISAIAILCIAVGSGAAGAINMWYERDIDAVMKRTKNRPLPTNRLLSSHAIEFASVLAASSVIMMAVAVNLVAAALLLVAILFYVFIYTIWLKPITPQNIVIGGAAGAFPPVIGWAAVTGNVSIEPILLFLITFMWTPPHFWALALYRSDDYTKAGIPMLPVVAGQAKTRVHILVYTLLLLPVSLLPYFNGMAGTLYAVGTLLLGLGFLYHAVRVYRSDDAKIAMKMFGYSIFYLFIVYSLLIIETLVRIYAQP
ncbi:MAG: protoheme IX farnesyltransferase [Proteobacteria bacterium]|nr:protoheme IX farnesyltransferase [Pseudomonadota bacterium]